MTTTLTENPLVQALFQERSDTLKKLAKLISNNKTDPKGLSIHTESLNYQA